MKIPETAVAELLTQNYSKRFDNTFMAGDEEYHYFVHNSLFFAQVCRAYSLLAKELGVNSAEYDYIRKNTQVLSYVKSVNNQGEELIESNALDERDDRDGYLDWMNSWIEYMKEIPFEDKEKANSDFYKQWFYALLIFDDDKQITLVKNKDGKYRIGDYFDYGGVYFYQDSNELDNDVFFDEEAYLEFSRENDYSREQMAEDIDFLIEKEVVQDYHWRKQYDEVLEVIIPHLDDDFINRCFSINIEDVLDKDDEHTYSDNFKKVISAMLQTSRATLMDKVEKMKMMTEGQNTQAPPTNSPSSKK